MSAADPGGTRRLDRRIDLEATPSGLYDVDVLVVYEDGTVATVGNEHLSLVEGGVRVENYPLAAGKRVMQVRVDYGENVYPWTRLWAFLKALPGETRSFLRELRGGN